MSLLGVIVAFTIVGIMFSQHRKMQINQARAVANRATQLVEDGDAYLARKSLIELLPDRNDLIPHPCVPEADVALRLVCDNTSMTLKGHIDVVTSANFSADGKYIVSASRDEDIKIGDLICFKS